MNQPYWQPCAVCHTPTQDALVGNRPLSLWNVQRLPAEGTPAVSWRCEHHRHYKVRAATGVWANAYGDLCFLLACGHHTHWVLRGRWAYTSARVERGVETGQITLEQRQRCYVCADLERESERQP